MYISIDIFDSFVHVQNDDILHDQNVEAILPPEI